MALNWGEDVALEVGGHGTASLTGRKSKWRSGAPSEAQLKYGYSLRIPGVTKREGAFNDFATNTTVMRDVYETTLSKGELSEAIDNVNAARRIDPLVKVVTGA